MQPKHMTQTTQVYHLPLVALLEQMRTAQATLSLSTILLLGTREEARMLRPRLRGGQFKVTHLVHLGSSASAMTVRLMQHDVWLACCTCSREVQQIRQITPRTPLVICSDQEEEAHIVSMLDAGADDYVFFSCGKQELYARLHGHARRYRASLASSCDVSRRVGPCSVLESEDQLIRLLCKERCVVVRGQMLRLTPIECTLLFTLMREGGEGALPSNAIHAVWGTGYHEEVDYIRVYLHTLRLKLQDDPKRPSYLETITGVGYRFSQQCVSVW
ncbi:winged helix-turn-helix domain-containing protein [Ktedonobacter racemifer]|uniref:Two component transcriptional regulator, winged helix family n=1 Tax=Ktedonobacter racemifer DSM 44963 TaxID=485913 RepID=D6U186_KTERA|nr:response regulator transcription factor [Ktedonobacter racemifer]EFH82576.1 two component transcriptional regulator, winged helix family [Ktedonobacter racemifer DSM 44963]